MGKYKKLDRRRPGRSKRRNKRNGNGSDDAFYPEPKTNPYGLTRKRWRFCIEYVKDYNGKAAYRRAGYKGNGNSAESYAAQLLRDPKVDRTVKYLQSIQEQEALLDQQRILEELAKIALLDVRRLFDQNGNLKNIFELDDFTAAAISGVDIVKGNKGDLTTKVRTWDKQRALIEYGKHLGMFQPLRVPDVDPRDIAQKIQAAQQEIQGMMPGPT